jgi:hypothetical protein
MSRGSGSEARLKSIETTDTPGLLSNEADPYTKSRRGRGGEIKNTTVGWKERASARDTLVRRFLEHPCCCRLLRLSEASFPFLGAVYAVFIC